MWMRFPEGMTHLSVEQQNFTPEIEVKPKKGEEGPTVHYVRVPDHFAGIILDMGLGFKKELPPEEANAPPDLPKLEALHADARSAALLASQVDTLTMERDEARAQLAEVSTQRDDLALKLDQLQKDSNPEEVLVLEKECDRLKAENADLTAALTKARADLAAKK